MPNSFRHTHLIAACYVHFVPEENPEYLSHLGISNNIYSRVDKSSVKIH